MDRVHIITDGVVVDTILATLAEAQQAYPEAVCIDGAEGAIGWLYDSVTGTLTAPPVAPRPLAELQAQAWASIQVERERRRVGGVKAGQHWFHSDDASRIQQLGLVMLGANVPPIQWKTLKLSGPPVFVTMSQQLAGQIFQAVVTWDAQVFAASETHRAAMEASADPSTYDFSGGWPVAIWEEPAP